MAYDPNKDYARLIREAIARGDSPDVVRQLNTARNEKIAANQAHYNALNIGNNDQHGTAAQNYIAGYNAAQRGQTTSAPAASTAALREEATRAAGAQRLQHVDAAPYRGMLQQERDLAAQQYYGQIDRATAQGVNALEQAREEAETQYQRNLNEIDRDAARARDNSALNAAARGDRGGIGEAQYDAILAAQTTNRATVRNAQTALTRDTMREITQLRANGEFQKAEAYIQLQQSYLSNLRQLEMDMLNANLSIDQFNASVSQWLQSYLLQLRQMDISTEQFEKEMALQNKQFDEGIRQFNSQFNANREDAAFNREVTNREFAYRQNRDAITDQRYSQEYADNRADIEWNRNYQLGRDAITDQRYNQEYADSRADIEWNRNYQLGRDAESDRRYEEETTYNRAITERQLAGQELDRLASLGRDILNTGTVPRQEYLDAMGITTSDAEQIAANIRLQNQLALQSATEKADSSGSSGKTMTLKEATEALEYGDNTPGALATWEAYHGESWYDNHTTLSDYAQKKLDTYKKRLETVAKSANPEVKTRDSMNAIIKQLEEDYQAGRITDGELYKILKELGG